MWREKLIEIKKEKGITSKMMSERSGLTVETIYRSLNPKHESKDSINLSTFLDLCASLEVEAWEVFYVGDKSFVSLQAEISALKAERDALLSESAVLKDKIDTLKDKVDTLKDEVIATHNYYIKQKSNN